MGWPTVLWNASGVSEQIQNFEKNAKQLALDARDGKIQHELKPWLQAKILELLSPPLENKLVREVGATVLRPDFPSPAPVESVIEAHDELAATG